MRLALLGVVLLVGAGAVAWLLLGGSGRPRGIEDAPERRDTRPPPPAPPARAPDDVARVPGPPPDIREPEDPEWITAPLPLPKGTGPLKGSELIAAVEAAGKVRFRGATPADLEALRVAVFEEAARDVEHPHAAMMGWLKDAGFEVEVAYPTLIVRRKAPGDAER